MTTIALKYGLKYCHPVYKDKKNNNKKQTNKTFKSKSLLRDIGTCIYNVINLLTVILICIAAQILQFIS